MYLQTKNILHRDLKLSNIFLGANLEVKVGDFGMAFRLENYDEKRFTFCGTPNYIAPEMLDCKKGYAFEVDTWALGIVIYTLLIGKGPFQSHDVEGTY
jgi:serine/threonine protein kinase